MKRTQLTALLIVGALAFGTSSGVWATEIFGKRPSGLYRLSHNFCEEWNAADSDTTERILQEELLSRFGHTTLSGLLHYYLESRIVFKSYHDPRTPEEIERELDIITIRYDGEVLWAKNIIRDSINDHCHTYDDI